jgi:hypothetical protein
MIKLTMKELERFIDEEIQNLILDAPNKPTETKYKCKVTDVDVEKGYEKQKDAFDKTREYPVVKTTRVQKCRLKLA